MSDVPPQDRRCRNCRFWLQARKKDFPTSGECRRNAPLYISGAGHWPYTYESSFCGEWEASPIQHTKMRLYVVGAQQGHPMWWGHDCALVVAATSDEAKRLAPHIASEDVAEVLMDEARMLVDYNTVGEYFKKDNA